jgi:hypothetical protein
VLRDEPFRQKEFSRRVPMEFFDKTIYVVSPEDLILSKLIWIQSYQSPVQMEDIKNLLSTDKLDRIYIEEWVRNLNLNTFDLLK